MDWKDEYYRSISAPLLSEIERLRAEIERLKEKAVQMRAALEEIREKAVTVENGGAWAAGIATLCLGTLEEQARCH